MIDDQLHRQLVREYLEEVDDVLADFDVTLGNLSAGSADTTAEGKRLFAAFSVLRAQGRGLRSPSWISRCIVSATILRI